MTFKIEMGIPLPPPEPEDEDASPTQWQPYRVRGKSRCRPNGACSPAIGKCDTCGDIFPCPSGNCGHWDCADPSMVGLDCPGNGTRRAGTDGV